jgi:short-subunit dehydrogenase
MKRHLRGCRAIVTGAACGIGRARSWELAKNGVALVIVDRCEGQLLELAKQIAALGVAVDSVAGDVTDPQTRERAIEVAGSTLGGLDILVNNAGLGAMGLFSSADPRRARDLMEVNYFSPMEMIRLALPMLMRGTRPIVVNVGSAMGLRGVPHNSEYCASKSALHGFSDSIRAEFAQLGIDVLLVCPGTTATEFFHNLLEHNSEAAFPRHRPTSAARVGKAIVRGIRLGRHRVIPYRRAKILDWLNRLSPRMIDSLMAGYVAAEGKAPSATPSPQSTRGGIRVDAAVGHNGNGQGKPELSGDGRVPRETTDERRVSGKIPSHERTGV